jgi:hypothetical protein
MTPSRCCFLRGINAAGRGPPEAYRTLRILTRGDKTPFELFVTSKIAIPPDQRAFDRIDVHWCGI